MRLTRLSAKEEMSQMRGIARMRTNAPDIYDYDCAKIGEGNFQLWAKATEQNRVAEPHAPTSDRKINTAQILRL